MAAPTVTGCAIQMERTDLGTEAGGFQVTGSKEAGPLNFAAGYAGVRNHEPVAMRVGRLLGGVPSGTNFRVDNGVHVNPDAVISGPSAAPAGLVPQRSKCP
jgi:hypothetical protein